MSRRHSAVKRIVLPDAKYNDKVVAKFINNVMEDGKKAVAEKIVYSAFDILAAKTKQDALSVFNEAIDNVKPVVEVKSRRVGGATYQVPCEVRADRRQALAIRWIIAAAELGRRAFSILTHANGFESFVHSFDNLFSGNTDIFGAERNVVLDDGCNHLIVGILENHTRFFADFKGVFLVGSGQAVNQNLAA